MPRRKGPSRGHGSSRHSGRLPVRQPRVVGRGIKAGALRWDQQRVAGGRVSAGGDQCRV